MTYTAVLVGLLVFLAGVIAYTGDVLGTVVGKRRLSLFGARPKRSGRIIGVMAGILIMLVTLLILALAFRNATRVLFNVQSVQEQNAQLSAQQRALESQVATQTKDLERARDEVKNAEASKEAAEDELRSLEQQEAALQADIDALDDRVRKLNTDLEDAQRELRAAETARNNAEDEAKALTTAIGRLQVEADLLQDQNGKLEAENETLQGLNRELETINTQLREQITEQNTSRRTLEDQVERLTAQLGDQAQALEQARSQAQSAGSLDLSYTVNQAVHTGVLSAQTSPDVRAQLAQLLTDAEDKVLQHQGGGLSVSPEQIQVVVEQSIQTPGADVLTLRSPENQHVGESVRVILELEPNTMLFARGELIASQQIHLGSPELQEQRNTVRLELGELFSAASSTLISKGLADNVYPVTAETSLEIEGFTNQLLRLNGPVVVGVTAGEDIYTGGPAQLEFIIIN